MFCVVVELLISSKNCTVKIIKFLYFLCDMVKNNSTLTMLMGFSGFIASVIEALAVVMILFFMKYPVLAVIYLILIGYKLFYDIMVEKVFNDSDKV